MPRPHAGGSQLDAHGGYLIRVESLGNLNLGPIARQSLLEDGAPPDTVLALSVYHRRKIVRLALEHPQTRGPRGAYWYAEHQSLARNLSRSAGVTVHAYVYAPEDYEEVQAFGRGQHVGGERLLYKEVELPESPEGEFDDQAFARMQSRWPLGHLAWVFGVEREMLLGLRDLPTTRLALDTAGAELPLGHLLQGIAA